MARSSSSPLRTRGFPALLTSYTVNELGDSVGLVALAVLVYDRTGEAMATTAFFMTAKFLPALLAPVLVARLDQLAVGRVLPALYGLEGLVFLALATQVESFTFALVLVLALVDGLLALAGRGISRGAVATLLGPRGQLREGNALLNIAFGLASVVGLAAGGILVSAASIQTALLVDALSFWLIAVLLLAARGLPGAAAAQAREPLGRRLRGGVDYVRRSPLARAILCWQALALVFFTVVLPIEVVYASETLNTGSAGFGALVASWSAGILAGSLLFVRIRRASPIVLVLASSAAVGAAYLGMSLVRDLATACAFSVLGGIGNGVQWVSVMTLLQESTPGDLQARIAGLLESVAAAVPGIGFLIGGVLTTLTSPPVAYAAAGGGILVLVALAWPAAARMGAAMGAPALRPDADP